jgi:hypothetical protein
VSGTAQILNGKIARLSILSVPRIGLLLLDESMTQANGSGVGVLADHGGAKASPSDEAPGAANSQCGLQLTGRLVFRRAGRAETSRSGIIGSKLDMKFSRKCEVAA